jgi:hypothetical protein
MRGAILPLLITPSWRGEQLKHRDNFTFTFTLIFTSTTIFNYRFSGDNKLILCGSCHHGLAGPQVADVGNGLWV